MTWVSISETPMIEGENQLAQGVLRPPCIQSTVPSPSMPINRQTNKHYKNIIMLIWFPVYLFLINCPTSIYTKSLKYLAGGQSPLLWEWPQSRAHARQTMTPPRGESVVFWFSIPLSEFLFSWGGGGGSAVIKPGLLLIRSDLV